MESWSVVETDQKRWGNFEESVVCGISGEVIGWRGIVLEGEFCGLVCCGDEVPLAEIVAMITIVKLDWRCVEFLCK